MKFLIFLIKFSAGLCNPFHNHVARYIARPRKGPRAVLKYSV